MEEEILPFLKLIADKTRLSIVGLLADQPRSGDELAAILDLNPSTVSQHISRMKKLGLIQVRAEQYYNIYEVDFERFNAFVGGLTAVQLATHILNSPHINQEAYQQQILDKWLVDNSIQGVPSQIQHRPVLIAWLTDKFEQDKKYGREQVRDVLAAYCNPKVQKDWLKILQKERCLSATKDKYWFWRSDSPLAKTAVFDPSILPQADLDPAIQAPRWRDGRLTVSRDPELHRRNLLAIALRLKSERPYSPGEIDTITATYSEGDPSAFRQELVNKKVIHLQDDGTYQRDALAPDHQIWGSRAAG